jgi:two-component system sensor histidine kinase KdpD
VARGTFRIYLGAAPGVGKTFAMLSEGNRRAERGTQVLIGHLNTRGRARTEEQQGSLPSCPLEHVIDRHPSVVLIDDIAERDRWRQVDQILGAGIDVVATMNVQHIASLADVVQRVTGKTVDDVVPDAFVRSADQVELVDISPEALRRRLAHGNVFPASEVDAELADYFRPGNLAALRELALLWVADRVDRDL